MHDFFRNAIVPPKEQKLFYAIKTLWGLKGNDPLCGIGFHPVALKMTGWKLLPLRVKALATIERNHQCLILVPFQAKLRTVPQQLASAFIPRVAN